MDKPKNPYRKGTLIWSVMEGDWENLTISQIAEVLDTTPSSVNAYIVMIKQKTGYKVPHKRRKRARMSKKHYDWWGYVKSLIRAYPGSRSSELSGVALRNHEAVKKAVDDTMMMEDGANRLKVISMVHWEQTGTLEGAALAVSCDGRTAYRWQRSFFEEVARNRGLLD